MEAREIPSNETLLSVSEVHAAREKVGDIQL